MRFITFSKGRKTKIGVLVDEDKVVIDLSVAAPKLPTDMNSFISGGASALEKARQAVAKAKPAARILAKKVKIMAPIPTPHRNVMAVGKNYYDHAEEFDNSGFNQAKTGGAIPEFPIIFTMPPTAVIGPDAPIPGYLDYTKSVDYEVELGVVIGKQGRKITKKDSLDYVFGYTIINDVTARKQQFKHNQWFIGKGLDGFCPMGPCIVTADEIGDVRKLGIRTEVNGELRQNSFVKNMIFDVQTLIKTLSAGMTLLPGDVIATGTPLGIGGGFNPPKFLKRGDVVTMSIDQIGVLENPVE
jgi:2-keto-4-pentenoate hydratase/2-oxohepta-3-ene-1,7-dioic acid hydratase in catechol pathway